MYVFHLWEKIIMLFLQYKKENQELSSLVEKDRPLLTETKGTNIQKIEKTVGHRNIVPYQIAQAR